MLRTVEDVVAAVGGRQEAAKLAGVIPQAVTNWRARGSIPPEYWLLFRSRLGSGLDPRVFRLVEK